MVGELVRGVEARFPSLATWLSDRLDVDVPAYLVSLTLHGILLIALAFVGYRVHREALREFKSEVVDSRVTSPSTFQDLDQSPGLPAPEPAAGSFAPTLATTISAAPRSAEKYVGRHGAGTHAGHAYHA